MAHVLHMDVITIQPEYLNDFVGETVLPYSQTLEVSEYIYGRYSTAEKTFCLSGQLHRHKAFLPLRPDANKLLVTAISHGKCG